MLSNWPIAYESNIGLPPPEDLYKILKTRSEIQRPNNSFPLSSLFFNNYGGMFLNVVSFLGFSFLIRSSMVVNEVSENLQSFVFETIYIILKMLG